MSNNLPAATRPTANHRPNRARWTTTVAFGALVALGLSSCGKLAEVAFEEGLEQVVEHDSGENVEIDLSNDGSISVSGDDGDFAIDMSGGEDGTFISGTDENGDEFALSAGNDFPEDWPSEVPAPPGTVVGSTIFTENGRAHVSLIMQVVDAVSTNENYINQLIAAGFTVTSDATYDTNGVKSTFAEVASSNWTGSIIASDEGDGQLMVNMQQVQQ